MWPKTDWQPICCWSKCALIIDWQPVLCWKSAVYQHASIHTLWFQLMHSYATKRSGRWCSGLSHFLNGEVPWVCSRWVAGDGCCTSCWGWWTWRQTTAWSKPTSTPHSPVYRCVKPPTAHYIEVLTRAWPIIWPADISAFNFGKDGKNLHFCKFLCCLVGVFGLPSNMKKQ